jgi:DNA-binding CsgD family transcriptional regulator/predicted negative regulator of RcsB-dependent stress response
VVRDTEDAREAFDSQRWGDAFRLLSAVAVDALDIDDLDRRATAAYLTGHDEEGFACWVRAHQLCVEQGAVHRGAYFGIRLAQGLGFKGDLGRCRGWVDRTARLLSEAGIDCVEQGYLEHGLAMMSIFEIGDMAGARAHFVQAGKIGARFAHRELVTLARLGEGRMLIYLGEIAEGMALLDEAMVSIEARELSPLATGDAYCTVIDACSELFDLGRCRSWTDSFTRWCDTQQELVLYRGHCFLHRAEVLGMLGTWPEALREARHACDRLAAPANAALGSACAIEGDLLRLVGDFDGAEASYERANEFGQDPQPGLALLRLAQGRLDGADAMIRRVLGETENPLWRARILGPYVEIVLAVGDVDAARTAAAEFRGIAVELGTPFLRAHAARAQGSVLLAEDLFNAALVELRHAFNEFQALSVRYDAARTRLLIGDACAALGDREAAEMEWRSARSALEALGAHPIPRTTVTAEQVPPDGLTQREREVLVLLARGKTNRTIAGDLFISEKTVASHVSHIFTKLGLTSRSAATAYAYEHDLV